MMKQAAIIKPHSDTAFRLTVGPPSHWRCGRTITGLMQQCVIALVPAALLAFWRFGMPAVQVVGVACAAAVATEALVSRLRKRSLEIDNWNAFYAGLLFAFLLPPGAPWWLAAVGGVVTVALGQSLFGGLGSNPFCAPLVGWAVCKVSWPAFMDADLALAALPMNEPLAQLKYFGLASLEQFDLLHLFLGEQVNAIGASQVAALLAGGLYLMVRGIIKPFVPLAFLAGLVLTAGIHWGIDPTLYAPPQFHLLTGSVVLGAFFLATDHGSSPCGVTAMILFGLLAGSLVAVIRIYGVYLDGVPFAILLANLMSPLLERIRPRPFGARRKSHA
ncbi:MAG: RnfABCDGE type electron transport complex subunit D [Desulfovibrionaceae bacterium]